jgi:hypothetical protein
VQLPLTVLLLLTPEPWNKQEPSSERLPHIWELLSGESSARLVLLHAPLPMTALTTESPAEIPSAMMVHPAKELLLTPLPPAEPPPLTKLMSLAGSPPPTVAAVPPAGLQPLPSPIGSALREQLNDSYGELLSDEELLTPPDSFMIATSSASEPNEPRAPNRGPTTEPLLPEMLLTGSPTTSSSVSLHLTAWSTLLHSPDESKPVPCFPTSVRGAQHQRMGSAVCLLGDCCSQDKEWGASPGGCEQQECRRIATLSKFSGCCWGVFQRTHDATRVKGGDNFPTESGVRFTLGIATIYNSLEQKGSDNFPSTLSVMTSRVSPSDLYLVP